MEDIILDIGAARTLVRGDLVPPETIHEGEVTVRCAHSDDVTYPLAEITISMGSHQDIAVKAAVSRTLPAAVLLGRDVPELMDLLSNKPQEAEAEESTLVLVATRIQARRQQQEEYVAEGRMRESGVTSSNIQSKEDSPTDTADGLPSFDDSLFTGGRERACLTWSQKRENRR